ncbi:RagB/SusD family nutrient uptake outer membrane protein [Mangrovimonas sp. ST2L15]|uniref:RagB/SusD family nutrient uptake outer membrane protein n=1 Tax=Mangrovimonas sp. ST2L15 TaxID=1645916 RepID=UPI001E333A0C|nr:RagB/SusD family nutrient uptake outer membrane protein [Mangrovimonas sp. ST2L15]
MNSRLYVVVLSLFGFMGCSDDFLDAEPLTEQTTSNFYQTTEDAWTALVGCYDGMQVATGAYAEGFYTVSEVLSDDCFGGTGNSDGFGYQAMDEFDINRAPGSVNLLGGVWAGYYKGINRVNTLLQYMDQINWEGQDALRERYESEARFIRAYLYFDMVRLWGNIPLLTEPSAENIPQSDPDEVYAVIAQDLLFAASHLPEEAYSAVENGRVTRWAAKSMLGRVYLYYTGYYGQPDLVGLVSSAEALQHLEDVIEMSGHGLVSDFSQLWPAASTTDYAGEDNLEVVFSVKYTHTSDYNGNTDGNHWMVMFGMREFSSFPYGNGWGVTVNSKLYDLYSDTDSRRLSTIIAIEEEEVPFDNQAGQREYTGYYNKKYAPMVDEEGSSLAVLVGGVNFMIGQFQDYTVMRYADVLLMAAELGSANAQTYFNEVRQRAYGDDFSQIAPNQQNIMNERHLEFALEGIRYWDLMRQGVGTAASEIAESTVLLNGGVETDKTISASKIEATQGLSQIPNSQIALSGGVLQQNAGW